MSFDTIISNTMTYEGGYVVDHAGPTNFGITQKTYDAYNKSRGLPLSSVKGMKPEMAKKVAYEDFFLRPKFDKFSDSVAEILFDYGFHAGPRTAVKSLQKVVGSKVDGAIGPNTIKATNDFIQQHGEKELLQKMINERQSHNEGLIIDNPTKYKKYEEGWKNRIQSIKDKFDLSFFNILGTNAYADEIDKKVFSLDEALNRQPQQKKVFSLDDAMNRPSPAMDKAEKRGFGEQVKYFLGEAIAKPLGSAIVRTPASFENILQVGFDQVRNIAQKQLNDDRAVFGISKEEFESRTPEQKQRIATNNKIVENMDRALDISSRLQENWEYLSQSGGLELDPELHKGTFLENPSFTRALALGIQSVPVLGMAAAVTAFTKSPIIGAGLIGTMEAAEEYSISREKGVSAESAAGLFALNTVVMSALETVPLTGFMKGGSLPVRAFRGAIQEGAEEALQGVWRNSIAKIGYDETRVISEGIVEGFIAGFVSGGVIGSFSGSGDSIQKKIDNAREQGVDVDTMIDALGKQVVENADAITETFLEKTSSEDFYKNQKIIKKEIPKFKNTEDAVNFGKTATPEQVSEMQSQRESLLKEIEVIKLDDSDEAMQKGMDLAVEAQFLREAVEGSQGKIDLDKIKAKIGIVKKPQTAADAVKQGMSAEIEGTGETKTRGLSLSVEEKAIEKGLVESLEGLPEYSKISMADQASKSNELLIQDYEKAKRIAMGQEVPPSDILPESMFMAVKNKAIRDGDVMTIKDLAISSQLTTEATTMGQRISALADRDPTSPIKAIKEIAKAREKRVGAKKPQVKREVKNIKKHISQLNKAQNWEQFVRSLQC